MALELAGAKIRVNGVAVTALNTTFRAVKETGITEFENRIFLENVAELKPLKTNDKVSVPYHSLSYSSSYLALKILQMLSCG